MSDAFVRLAVGLIALVFALNRKVGSASQSWNRSTVVRGIFWGSVSGFTGTLANAGGPPFLIYVLPQKLEKLTFAGTMAIYFAVLNAIKIIPIFVLGQFSPDNLKTSVVLLPLAVATNFFGLWLVRKTPTVLFYKIAYILVFFIALALIWQGASAMLAH